MYDATQSADLAQQSAEASTQRSNFATHRVGPLESHTAAVDRLHSRLAHAHALLSVIGGEGAEIFRGKNATIQSDYVECIENLISAARVDADIVITSGRTP
ncbi:MAG TPA: hypothetical protein VFI49_08085 [Rudaea sp.]|nr:hypothetical protein [Rudaea sp.]